MRTLPYVLIFSLLTGPAALAKPSQGHQSKLSKQIQKKEKYSFPRNDVRVIHDYYTPRYRSLPPGLQKKLYRTGQLPPGWQKKLRPLPVAVERRLTPVPSIYRRGLLGDQVVVLDPRRQMIVDVVPAFLRQ